MGKYLCAVPHCGTSSDKGMVCFPTDPVRRQAWLNIFGMPTFSATKWSKVCTKHFDKADFQVARNSLRPGTLPTQNLPKTHSFVVPNDVTTTLNLGAMANVAVEEQKKKTEERRKSVQKMPLYKLYGRDHQGKFLPYDKAQIVLDHAYTGAKPTDEIVQKEEEPMLAKEKPFEECPQMKLNVQKYYEVVEKNAELTEVNKSLEDDLKQLARENKLLRAKIKKMKEEQKRKRTIEEQISEFDDSVFNSFFTDTN